MRIARVLAPIALVSLGGVAFAAPSVSPPKVPLVAIKAAPRLPAANPQTVATGGYLLFLNPKKIGVNIVHAKRAGILPVYVKTDGKTIVMGGKSAPQMTGTISGGKISLTHVPGTSFTLSGATFNGYAASGTFSGGAPGNFVGTWALVSASAGGLNFMNRGGPGATSWGGKTSGLNGSLSNNEPAGVSNQWGYDGPGLNLDGNEGSQNAFATPGGISGYNAAGDDNNNAASSKKTTSWSSGLNITGGSGGSTGGTDNTNNGTSSTTTQKDQANKFQADDKGGAQTNAPLPVNSGSLADEIYCAFAACSDPPPPTAPMGGSSPGGAKAGGFTAGDWDPPAGDTSPGQKIHVGGGQDTGNGGSATTTTGKIPTSAGDPGDFFQAATGDILNTSKLFNGASDPVLGANFGR